MSVIDSSEWTDNDPMFANIPSPVSVRAAHIRTRADQRASYDKRVQDAREHGYKGVMTRAELAAQCLRNQRDNA
jgi:hypothetical protein